MYEVLQWANLMVVPGACLGYIVVLERRITRLQTQIEFLVEQLKGKK